MVIDFSGGITEAKVQQMINDAMDFTTGVINLTNATAEQVKEAFTDPDRWICTITYSGATYMEQYRLTNTGDTVNIHFYVPAVSASTVSRRINDGVYHVTVNTSTGAVSGNLLTYTWAPDIIYDLDDMSAEQLKFLSRRIENTSSSIGKDRFSMVWNYHDRTYVYSGLKKYALPTGTAIAGTALDYENGGFVMYYDFIVIDSTDGTISHYEYVSNIAFTPVQ